MPTANLGTFSMVARSPITPPRIFQTNRAFVTEDGPIQARTLGLTLSRHLGGGMHEDIDISNNSQKPVRFNLEIAARADFADIFEVKSNRIVRRGRISTSWSESRQQFRLTYRNKDFCREVIVTANPTGAKGMYANGRLSFEISLDPDESWHCCLLYDLVDGENRHTAPRECLGQSHKGRHTEAIEEWERTVLKIRTSNEEFYRCYNQGIQDMAALRLPIAGTDHMVFIPAAGLPWFVALFGRDSLIVSLQTMLVYPEFARGALDVLGAHQAQERDDYRDAEPGKILHELRYGELAHFKLIPHTPYYGTSDATPLYLIALHSAWRATGDRSLIERHLRTAEGCLDWIDNYGDRDGDGFQEYQTRSSAGYENTGWKDSGDSVDVHRRHAGERSEGAVRIAGLRLRRLGSHGTDLRHAWPPRPGQAPARKGHRALPQIQRGLLGRGVRLLCLHAGRRQEAGILGRIQPGPLPVVRDRPEERAGRVVKRLMQPDMWSGWGIRTLSASHRAFNPYNYQTGAVWPHDNAIIAVGFRRYGFAAEAAAVARSISDAASIS